MKVFVLATFALVAASSPAGADGRYAVTQAQSNNPADAFYYRLDTYTGETIRCSTNHVGTCVTMLDKIDPSSKSARFKMDRYFGSNGAGLNGSVYVFDSETGDSWRCNAQFQKCGKEPVSW